MLTQEQPQTQQQTTISAAVGREIQYAAEWCARRALRGNQGEPLPDHLSREAIEHINSHRDEFRRACTKVWNRRNRKARERGMAQAYRDAGMVRVRGALGGTYWE